MFPLKIRTARLLGRHEFHQLNPRKIHVEHIQLFLPIQANLLVLVPVRFPSVRNQDSFRLVHVRDSQRYVIHHSSSAQIRIGPHGQHVLKPIRTIRHLHRHPVRVARIVPAMPVHMKAKYVVIERVRSRLVSNDCARMNQPSRARGGNRRWLRLRFRPLHKFDFVPIRIAHVSDPDGDTIEFVERAKSEAKPMPPASACSRRLIHTGAIVRNREAADAFYRDTLGFHVYWHGGHDANHTDWLAMQVPDGTDWFEYMLSVEANPDLRTTGVMNHISLGVVDMDKAEAILVSQGWKAHGDEHQQVGMDGKKQLNVFDADFTRIELMEFVPFQKPCCSDFQGKHPSETN